MLDIDWVTILWEVINFLIITVALYFLVFKPIVRRSEQQAERKEQLMQETVEDRENAARQLREIETRLNLLDQEIEQILDEAYEKNKQSQTELLDATREEARIILQDVLVEVQKEQLMEMRKHRDEVVETIFDIAGEMIRKVLPPTVHTSLVAGLDQKIWDLGKTDMRLVNSIRETLSGITPSAQVAVASPLTVDEEQQLIGTFSALADDDVDVDFEIDEKLIAGIRVTIGDLIIDHSLMAQLRASRDVVEASLQQMSLNNNG